MNRFLAAAPVLLVLLLTQVKVAGALDPNRPLDRCLHDHWTRRDGLPSDVVRSLALAKDGFLWLGTEDGLIRFDGASFTAFDRTTSPAVPTGTVVGVIEAQEQLWVAFDSDGLWSLDGRKAARHAETERPGWNYVRSLVTDAQGAVWAAASSGVIRTQGDRSTTFSMASGLPFDNLRALAIDRDGAILAGGRTGVARWDGQRFVPLPPIPGLVAHPSVRVLVADPDGGLWIGLDDHGLVHWKNGTYRRYGTADGLPSNHIRSLLRDRQGQLWVGTVDAGLARLSPDGRVDVWNRGRLSSDHVTALLEGDDGALWIGTSGGGLHRLREPIFDRVTKIDGLTDDRVSSVAAAPDGTIWIGSRTLARVQEGRLTVVADDPSQRPSNGMYVTRAGELWASTWTGLSHLQGGRLESANVSVPGRFVPLEHNGDLVLVGPRKFVQQGAGWKEEPLPHQNITIGTVGPSGTLWMASPREIFEVSRTGTRQYRLPADDVGMIVALHEDRAGTLWVGCRDSGLKRLRDGQFTTVGPDQGLPTTSVFSILEDADERLWLTSPRGILWVRKKDLEQVAAQPGRRLTAALYGADDGVFIRQQLMSFSPSARAPDGRLWFATEQGALWIDPRRVVADRPPRSVSIESLTVDGRTVSPTTLPQPVRLPARTRTVELGYTAPIFTSVTRVRFRHRLDGVDRDWVDAGQRRSANYLNLPPGAYTFRVAAVTVDGSVAGPTAALAFVVRPPFHRTYPFYAAVGLTVLASVFGVHRLRLRQTRARYQAVLDERGRIAREVHDGLAQGLVAVTTQIQCAREIASANPARVVEHLDQAAQAAKHTLEEARRTVHALRPHALDEADLAQALATVVRQMSSDRVPVAFSVEGVIPTLPANASHNLLRIGQEAVTNALRHARPARVEVRLQRRGAHLTLMVADDGQGFDPAATRPGSGHNGLSNMRDRASSIGAVFDVRTTPGAGTTITVELELS